MGENITCEIHDIMREGNVLTAFATVTIDGESKDVSYVFKRLPITEDGIVSALVRQFYNPEVAEESAAKTTVSTKTLIATEADVELPEIPPISARDEARLEQLQQGFADLKGENQSLIFEAVGGEANVGTND